jgi:hypothetical protein
MESVMLAIKFVMFVAMQVTVLAVIGAVVVAAVYQIVCNKVRESRQRDEITTEDKQQLQQTL